MKVELTIPEIMRIRDSLFMSKDIKMKEYTKNIYHSEMEKEMARIEMIKLMILYDNIIDKLDPSMMEVK